MTPTPTTQQQFELRRLEVGEMAGLEETDFYVVNNRTYTPGICYSITGRHEPHYRVVVKQPPAMPEQEQAKGPAASAPASEGSEVDPGEGWRLLNHNETTQAGDELWDYRQQWIPTSQIGQSVGTLVKETQSRYYRRRVPAPAPSDDLLNCPDVAGGSEMPDFLQRPQVDVVRHEVSELRKAIAVLKGENQRIKADHDWQHTANLTILNQFHEVCKDKRELTAERDQLQKVIDGYNVERDKLLAERNAAQAERDQLRAELIKAREDRDKKTLELGDALAQLATLTPAPEEPKWRDADERDIGKKVQVSVSRDYTGPLERKLLTIVDHEWKYIACGSDYHASPVPWKFARVPTNQPA